MNKKEKKNEKEIREYDVIVIGRGPAGLSASIYLKRANLNILVIGKDKGILKNVGEIENVYPLGKTTGINIQNMGEEHVKSLGIEILEDEVLRIEKNDENKYIVRTKEKSFKTKYIFLGIGFKRKKLDIENIEKYEGKGISYCAVCDGFFFKNKDIGIYGNSDYAIEEAKYMVNIANKVFILTDGRKPISEILKLEKENPDKYQVKEDKIQKVFGGERLETLEFVNGSQVNTLGIFIAEEANNKTFSTQLGILMEDDLIKIDENRRTNVKGIYAGGDVTKGTKQIIKAMYDGMIAALDIIKEYNKEKSNKNK